MSLEPPSSSEVRWSTSSSPGWLVMVPWRRNALRLSDSGHRWDAVEGATQPGRIDDHLVLVPAVVQAEHGLGRGGRPQDFGAKSEGVVPLVEPRGLLRAGRPAHTVHH